VCAFPQLCIDGGKARRFCLPLGKPRLAVVEDEVDGEPFSLGEDGATRGLLPKASGIPDGEGDIFFSQPELRVQPPDLPGDRHLARQRRTSERVDGLGAGVRGGPEQEPRDPEKEDPAP